MMHILSNTSVISSRIVPGISKAIASLQATNICTQITTLQKPITPTRISTVPPPPVPTAPPSRPQCPPHPPHPPVPTAPPPAPITHRTHRTPQYPPHPRPHYPPNPLQYPARLVVSMNLTCNVIDILRLTILVLVVGLGSAVFSSKGLTLTYCLLLII